VLARGFGLGLAEIWALTQPDNHRSARVCEKLGMRLLGTTNRWYDQTFLMFWIGAGGAQQPTLAPDHPTPIYGPRGTS
jgi:RimJ/RimL family protein N-acetyltransferase